MASYHLSVKTVKRSAGRSATAAAAYRHAERIECQREGRVHDYRAKSGVEHSFIVVGEGAPEWAQDRAALWNAAEAREGRRDSVVAREWELALPSELDGIGRRVLARTFARELVDRYGVAADVAVHAPHREGDQRNWHAHVLTTTRRMEAQGLTDKTKALDSKQMGGAEIVYMRERWADLQNQALERKGHEERVDHRSLEVQREAALAQGREQRAQELDRAAEIKLGPAVSGIERREQRQAEREEREYEPLTERGQQVHEARQARGLLRELVSELAQARERLAQELRERAELARQAYAHSREEGTSLPLLVTRELGRTSHPSSGATVPCLTLATPGPAHLALELRKPCQHRWHEPALDRGGVGPALTQGAEASPLGRERRQDFQEITCGPYQAAQARH